MAPSAWPTERDPLAEAIAARLAKPDWYSDLDDGGAAIWDEILHAMMEDSVGQPLGLDFQCTSDYESIYWDCAEEAAAQGAGMMAEDVFGSSGFRYSGSPQGDYRPWYSFFLPPQVLDLHARLLAVEPHFATLPGGEGSLHEQFFEGLLPSVRGVAESGRVLWVDTDT